mmetsp:Transcript_10372/g.19367  ORF Transcript_10372/g.19367 Transcript_10372/m.19367 type:complete len:798 (+) Transcript_10372:3577-5970(+)
MMTRIFTLLSAYVALYSSASLALHPKDEEFVKAFENIEFFQHEHMLGRRLRGGGNSDTFSYSFSALGDTHTIELKVHASLFSESYKHVLIHSQEKWEDQNADTTCIYTGDDAVFSFCDGMVHGKFKSNTTGEVLHIQPLPHDDTKHVVFRHRELQTIGQNLGSCGLEDESLLKHFNAEKVKTPIYTKRISEAEKAMHRLSHSKNNQQLLQTTTTRSPGSTRYVELVLFNDNARYKSQGRKVHSTAAYIVSLVDKMYQEFPGHHKINIQLVGMYTFAVEDAWKLVEVNDGKSIEAGDLLDSFSEYVFDTSLQLGQHDIVHLLSGHDFYSTARSNDGVIGLANVDGWCKSHYTDPESGAKRSSRTGITQATFSTSQYISNVVAHEIGHNFGFLHTNQQKRTGAGDLLPSETCYNSGSSFLMDPETTSDPGWSKCSEEWLDFRIFAGSGECTEKEAPAVWQTKAECGNGIVEAGEECDCLGNVCQSTDKCCNADTCKLVEGAECSELDPCCSDQCKIRKANESIVCRPSKHNICDPTPEMCDGTSSKCPVDEVEKTGTVCASKGSCYLGSCIDTNEQCKKISYDSACPSMDCNELKCAREGHDGTCWIGVGYLVEDGSPCGGGVCYQGVCQSDPKTLPTPQTLVKCSNNVLDAGETDVDCGGSDCLPCIDGGKCLQHTDCLYPSICNETDKICRDAKGSGIRDSVPTTEDDILNQVTNVASGTWTWVRANPFPAAAIASCIFFVFGICIYECIRPSNQKKIKERLQQKKQAPRYTTKATLDMDRVTSMRVSSFNRGGPAL